MGALDGRVRPLGPCEIYSSSRHSVGFYRCVANTCRYSVPQAALRGQAVRDAFETAVANVLLAIPSLTVGIVGQETSKPQFTQVLSINLKDHFEYRETADADPGTRDSVLLGILENQHDQPWPEIEHRPPWKLIVVARDAVPEDGVVVLDAVFAVHHSIADGRSTALFHTSLLNELNRSSGQPAQLSGCILNVTGSGARKLTPPMEELVKFSTSWGFLFQTLWRELGPAWLQDQPAAPWTGKAITREPCRTNVRLITVPAVAVPRLLAACRANQTTLTPLLHALALASFARHVPPEEAVTFHSSTPIDIRPFMDNSSDPAGRRSLFGVFITAQYHDFSASLTRALREGPSTDEIWKTAADLRRSMKQHLDNVPKDDIMSMLGWVTDWQKFWLSKVGQPRQDTWEVSNIGSMAGGHGETDDAARGWKIQRSLMSQGATVAGAAISISVAGVAGGEIAVVLGWQEGIVEKDTVDGLARDLQSWLDRLGQGKELN
ncbi:alcohol O-acetyltransferase 1 [Chaetomidium leptoderma]|uniref:Alcohol O-acetyltransferase 1 n=1 Tax=Chaetomidium leptoderma TaxID=669021 RepID=A0AAN6VQC1_9PEZI|nr:alcohol O-acetyltransferase 1 [Chaetomidium leptoderma]